MPTINVVIFKDSWGYCVSPDTILIDLRSDTDVIWHNVTDDDFSIRLPVGLAGIADSIVINAPAHGGGRISFGHVTGVPGAYSCYEIVAHASGVRSRGNSDPRIVTFP